MKIDFTKNLAGFISDQFLKLRILNIPDEELVEDRKSCDNIEELSYNLRRHPKLWENSEACLEYQEILRAYVNLSEAQKRRLFLNEKVRNFSRQSFYTHAEVIQMKTIFEIFLNLEANS